MESCYYSSASLSVITHTKEIEMKFHHLFLLLLFFSPSCTQSTPAPTATPVPTSTFTPPPTATQTPSQTPTPETWVPGAVANTGTELFKELFDSIKDSNPVLSADGNQILNAEDAAEILAVRNESGEWVSPIKMYSENHSIHEFRNPENFVPPEDLGFKGEYWKWAKQEIAPKVREWFMAHEDQIIDGKGEEGSGMIWIGAGGFMIPDRFIKENFSSEELPFYGKEVFHHTRFKFTQGRTFESTKGGSITANAGDEWLHTVIPFFLYDKKTQEISVIVTVAERPHENTITQGNGMLEQMNVLPLSITSADVSGFTNPIVEKALADSGLSEDEITQLMLLFSQGDVAALDGFVLNTMVTDHDVYR